MGVDVLFFVIITGIVCLCGGFSTYGCYRCFTDKDYESELRVPGNIEGYNPYPSRLRKGRRSLCPLFRKGRRRRCCVSCSSDRTSTTSLTGSIYTVHSNSSWFINDYNFPKEEDGKVPFEYLDRDNQEGGAHPRSLKNGIGHDETDMKTRRVSRTAPT